jgi:transcription initiation factor TFIIIB Brf1 subunit/transcription initiation factor TFIIB
MAFQQEFDDDEFAIFDRLRKNMEEKIDTQSEAPDCPHENTDQTEEGATVCIDCGLELNIVLDNSPEWRYYKENDTKNSADPSRCSIRKYEEKSIYRDLERYEIPREVVDRANDTYSLVTEESILRGNSRKGLIFACIYYAYEELGQRKSPDEMKSIFGINKKTLSGGMKMYNLKIKHKAVYTSPLDFIAKIMLKFDSSEQHIQFVTKLFYKIKNQTNFMNRSNPDSIAAALCYFFFKHIKYPISLNEFSKRVGLSDITVHKISKRIGELVQSVKGK